MPDLEFIHEYVNHSRCAHVFKHHKQPGYTVVCHDQSETWDHGPFDTEFEAENFAEDWVKGLVDEQQQDE